MNKRGIGNVFTPKGAGIKVVVTESLNVLAQSRGQRAFFGRAFAIGKAHGGVRIADMQGPHVGDEITPRGDLNFDA